jgi:peroxiredoxin
MSSRVSPRPRLLLASPTARAISAVSVSVSLSLISILILLVACVSRPARAGDSKAGIRPRAGDVAPSFALAPVDGGEIRALDQLVRDPPRGGVVLIFLSCRCPYVAQARQPLADLVQRFGAKVSFVGVNSNQNEAGDDIKADAARNFPFPILRDADSKVADLYGAARTPEVFLIDGKGVIRYHGGVADLGAALGDFTAGRLTAKSEAKAFGCTIKRKP